MLIALTLVMSGMTGLMMWLISRKDKRGWYVSLANQGLWFTMTVMTGAWGLLPLNVWLTYIAIRSIRTWN